MEMRLDGKNVLITGATGSIGRTTAKLFQSNGANLTLVGRDKVKLESLKTELGAEDSILFLEAESRDEAAIALAIESSIKKFGTLDAVLAIGGTEGLSKPLTQYTIEQFNEVLEVNVTGVWLLMKYATPVMAAQGSGSFVAISSGGGVVGFAGLCPYSASKHAVCGMVKTACLEFASDGVRCNALAPGPIDNRMMKSLHEQMNSNEPEAIRDFVAGLIPMKRYGTNEEIAQFALFLASDESSFCNGGVYLADGGLTAG